MRTSEVLVSARAIVAQGWCKYLMREDGNVCAIGAIADAEGIANLQGVYLEDLCPSPVAALHEHLHEFGDYKLIPDFNDAETTTLQDVLNLFDKAINSLEERGE